jgi:Flp pilus assembly protein TadG
MPRLLLRNLLRRFKDTEANALVEAALILPVLLLLLFAAIEFSGILFTQMALQNGVSLATRYAITRNVIAGQTRAQSITTTLRKEAPTLTIADADVSFSNMPQGSSVWVSGTGSPGSIERITVTHTWTVMTPFMRMFFPSGTLTLSAQSAMKNESDPLQ